MNITHEKLYSELNFLLLERDELCKLFGLHNFKIIKT